MTPDAIERLVSETIEPFERLKFIRYDDVTAWEIRFVGGGGVKYRPLPWLTDDRYTMRLFDEMVAEAGFDNASEWVFFRLAHGCTPELRRRAIAVEWLSWKGVPIEG